MSGGVSSILNTVTGGLLGGNKNPNNNAASAKDTAQEEADNAQKVSNAALSRKKNRSLLSTGANSSDTGGANVATAAKKLLGE